MLTSLIDKGLWGNDIEKLAKLCLKSGNFMILVILKPHQVFKKD